MRKTRVTALAQSLIRSAWVYNPHKQEKTFNEFVKIIEKGNEDRKIHYNNIYFGSDYPIRTILDGKTVTIQVYFLRDTVKSWISVADEISISDEINGESYIGVSRKLIPQAIQSDYSRKIASGKMAICDILKMGDLIPPLKIKKCRFQRKAG